MMEMSGMDIIMTTQAWCRGSIQRGSNMRSRTIDRSNYHDSFLQIYQVTAKDRK